MAVRDQPGARTDPSIARDERPVVVFGDPSARHRRIAWGLGLGVLLVAVGAGLWWVGGGGDDQVEARPATAAPAPAPVGAPAALTVSVRAPATVVAGHPARFGVSYTDGEGIFSGGIEDWGDVGVGSANQAACGSGPVATALNDRYVATHTWPEEGTYPVSIAVTSYTCTNGRATQETRKAQLTVVVDAR
jgi:hypothetical protein